MVMVPGMFYLLLDGAELHYRDNLCLVATYVQLST